MAKCLLSLGANMGQPAETIIQARDVLQSQLASPDFRCSRLFKTPPVGGPAGQPPFVNAVIAAETDWSEWQVWELIRKVEHLFGRQRNARWEARYLDVDILLYDNSRIWTPHLKIPHPRMCMRRFILQPACDVASEWIDPVSRMSLQQLSDRLWSPASLTLTCAPRAQAEAIATEAARIARAELILPGREHQHSSPQASGRWLELRLGSDLAAEAAGASPNAGLIVVLATEETIDGAAWEDQHRRLAYQLNLIDGQPQVPPWELVGPRYLLASTNRDWIIHELVAALEAMDCPVEALP